MMLLMSITLSLWNHHFTYVLYIELMMIRWTSTNSRFYHHQITKFGPKGGMTTRYTSLGHRKIPISFTSYLISIAKPTTSTIPNFVPAKCFHNVATLLPTISLINNFHWQYRQKLFIFNFPPWFDKIPFINIRKIVISKYIAFGGKTIFVYMWQSMACSQFLTCYHSTWPQRHTLYTFDIFVWF
jgi:hypothetical protein